LLYYHDLKAEGKKTQGNRTDLTSAPNGAKLKSSKVLADKAGVGQRAAIVILLYYHDLKAEARARQADNAVRLNEGLGRKTKVPQMEQSRKDKRNYREERRCGFWQAIFGGIDPLNGSSSWRWSSSSRE